MSELPYYYHRRTKAQRFMRKAIGWLAILGIMCLTWLCLIYLGLYSMGALRP